MDGLPLALDQAGAYIKETPCTLVEYLDLYRARNTDLLKEPREDAAYPDSVATTWSLSFEKVSQANPAATELLHLLAFLYPEAIPEEIVTEASVHMGTVLGPVATNTLQFDSALKEILRFSLVYRDPDTQTLTIHRLVQAVFQGKRAVRASRAVLSSCSDVARAFVRLTASRHSDGAQQPRRAFPRPRPV